MMASSILFDLPIEQEVPFTNRSEQEEFGRIFIKNIRVISPSDD